MNETIKKIKQIWKEIFHMSMLPCGASERINGAHIGMFRIHGHYIDDLTELIESLGTEKGLMEKTWIKKDFYDVQDIINAEFNLEPLKCRHCGEIGETAFNIQLNDAFCELCGKWQLGEN